MKPFCLVCFTILLCLFTTFSNLSNAQETLPKRPTHYLCDENAGCAHQYIDGVKYKILTTDRTVITAALSGNAKYARALIRVTNKATTPLDVLPDHFTLSEVTPKEREFAYVPYQKILQADEHRASWANAINAFGAGMAAQQVTTQTTNSGTVNATRSDGAYINGTYEGTSTSSTSVPNYPAQAQAQENILRRREAIAEESQSLSQSSLESNSLLSGQTISGSVYFRFDRKAKDVVLRLLIDHVSYEFPFTMMTH